jgi:hypothetical protein
MLPPKVRMLAPRLLLSDQEGLFNGFYNEVVIKR